jgi:predicted O-methyltransferase YrrM
MDLDSIDFDSHMDGSALAFEDLVAMFPSTPLSYGITLMTPKQLGYIFRVARCPDVRKAVEIGRYKGGATVAIAAAMAPNGMVWSIDNGSVENEVRPKVGKRRYDDQIRHVCERFGWQVQLLVGDSRRMDVDAEQLDLVLIDGDHSYAGAQADFQRWSKRVRVGGHMLLDDAFPLGDYVRHSDAVGRVVSEALDEGAFRLVRAVDRLAHLERCV